MNYYSFHIGDYAAHTKHLTLIEDLAYRRMLDLYYMSEKPLPLDVEKVARMIGLRDHIQEVSDVLSDFFLKSEEGYTSKRCDAEIAAYGAKAERAKAANKSRWAANKSEPVLKSDVKSDVKSDADQIPTNNQEPRTKNHKKPITPPVSTPPLQTEARGTRLPDDWTLPKEWAMWAMKERPKLTVQALRTIADEFKDYWISVPARKGTKLDWFATWRNHVRRTRPAPSPSRFFDGLAYVNRHITLPDDEAFIEH